MRKSRRKCRGKVCRFNGGIKATIRPQGSSCCENSRRCDICANAGLESRIPTFQGTGLVMLSAGSRNQQLDKLDKPAVVTFVPFAPYGLEDKVGSLVSLTLMQTKASGK